MDVLLRLYLRLALYVIQFMVKLLLLDLQPNSITVILALQEPSQILDWKIADLINDSVSIISSSSIWKAQKVHRSANFCAHYMAYWVTANAHFSCLLTYFFSLFPLFQYVVAKLHLPL